MHDDRIVEVLAWEALDSRGTPTVACEVRLASGSSGTAVVPSGASTGSHEAHELRDGGGRYGGRGVQQAVSALSSTLGPLLQGRRASDSAALDHAMCEADGTRELSRLGGNTVLAASIAVARAAAASAQVPLWRYLCQESTTPPLLPMPMVNIISGGAHAGGLLDIQDVLVVPIGADRFSHALEWTWRVRVGTAQLAAARGFSPHLVADEGGLAFPLPSNEAALDLVCAGIERAGLRPGADVALAVDIAANQLLAEDGYRLRTENRVLTAAQLIELVSQWARDYPLVSVEDVCAEDDWAGWEQASQRLASRVQLLGDDLFVTNPDRLRRGVASQIANAVLIKPNQNGTLSGARRVVDQARAAGYATVVSARSGDTEDSWLADLAVGWRTGQIKVGSLTRSERLAKWNRLLQLEAEYADRAEFAGPAALAPLA